MGDLFKEGGPHRVRRTGKDQYEMSVSLPLDEAGMMGRECPSPECSPAYFKVKPGTGLLDQTVAYCPYCRTAGDPTDFHTQAQHQYARSIAVGEASDGLNELLKDALGIGHTGKKKIDGGLISIEMSLKPVRRPPVGRPVEEELRRDLVCAVCGLAHAVFGLAVWCPDCGVDLFLSHVHQELSINRRILDAVPTRQLELGSRVAARDIENALEDTVSIFEAVLKAICRLHLALTGMAKEQIATTIESKVRNRFQSVALAPAAFAEVTGRDLFEGCSEQEVEWLRQIFEKRHPITHNLGVIDRKYLARVESGETLGREVRVTATEVGRAIDLVERVLAQAYQASSE